ncbi:MAG: hypothetical protein HY919_06685 [Elusimicrobia bacterium]|nr:hypothetical protein [Elusimicrobiota bacterium]
MLICKTVSPYHRIAVLSPLPLFVIIQKPLDKINFFHYKYSGSDNSKVLKNRDGAKPISRRCGMPGYRNVISNKM